MNAHSLSDHHVSDSSDSQRVGRAFAARLDMTIKRSRLSSLRVAKSLGVTEGDVALWRAGITLPRTADCRRLSELLHVDASWLSGGSNRAEEGERKSDRVNALA
jgi:transcriptional regulator with XRE-family HTH domain